MKNSISADPNAGYGAALAAHQAGNVDSASYSGHYGADAEANYTALAAGTIP